MCKYARIGYIIYVQNVQTTSLQKDNKMSKLIKCETANPDTECKISAISIGDSDDRGMGDIVNRVFLDKKFLKRVLTQNRPEYHEHPEKAHTYYLYDVLAIDGSGDDVFCDSVVVRLDYNSTFVQHNTPLCWM